MISKRFKVLEIVDGKEYVFSPFSFKASMSKFKTVKKEQGKNSEEAFEEIAEAAYVSVDALKNWMYRKNGPADLETVKRIAVKLEINYMELLKEQEKEKMSENKMANCITVDMNKTKDVIRVVYQKMAAFMDVLVNEICFGMDEATFYTYDEAYTDMLTTFHMSMLDIPIDIYDRLKVIIEKDLYFYFYGIPEVGVDVWDCSEYLDFCKEKNISEFVGHRAYMEHVAEKFYTDIRGILKDYLIH